MAAKKKENLLEQSLQTERKARLAAMEKVAKRFGAFKPVSEVLTNVKAVPTIFPQVNAATRVGGWPIERISLIHGPSSEGKTYLALGLLMSFLMKDHFAALVDAEYTTTDQWLRDEIMHDLVDHPGFSALRPHSYEQTRDEMKNLVETIGEARDKGEIDKDTTGLIVVDSVKKLIPERLIKNLEKDAEKVGIDGMSGRAAMYKAALNSQLMDEFVPLAYHAKVALLLIGRESENTAMSNPYDTPYKLSGGKALFYDSSLVGRITRSYYKEGDVVAGERHKVCLYKSKVGGKEGKYTNAYFHTSIGSVCPAGFDLASDVLEMALAAGTVEKKGGKHWLRDTGEVLGESEDKALKFLRENAETLEQLREQTEKEYKPQEYDADESQ